MPIRVFTLNFGMRIAAWVALVVVATPGGRAENPRAKIPAVVEFNRDVRPILSDNCYACHGPDKNKRKAELRLDTAEGLLGKSGTTGTVSAGKLDESELWTRVNSKAAKTRMPPPKFGKELSADDRAILRRWIEQGAKWEGHWSFLPIKRTRPPVARNAANAHFWKNEIDGFVLATLADHGLKPAAEADRITLIRRLHFDLIGLPPSVKDVDEFLADCAKEERSAAVDAKSDRVAAARTPGASASGSPGTELQSAIRNPQSAIPEAAYTRLVAKLLASPHFGERMAVWWLDLVRYADSVGYHGDQPVSISPFRDYVIASFNANKRFDRFTLEQLGGDLLPDATLEDKIAAGYNRLGMMSAEGGVQPKEYLAKYAAERVRNVGGAWLGATLGCCECHDHKFDPFPTRDFYAIEAVFADITEQGLYSGSDQTGKWGTAIQVPSPKQRAEKSNLESRIADTRKSLTTSTPHLAAEQSQWESQQKLDVAKWVALKPKLFTSAGKAKFKQLPDGSTLVQGRGADKDTYKLTIVKPPAGITAFRIDVLPDDSLPGRGPGRAPNGNFVLTEFEATLVPVETKSDASKEAIAKQPSRQPQSSKAALSKGMPKGTPIKLKNASATFEQAGQAGTGNPYDNFPASAAIDGDAKGPKWGWAIAGQTGRAQHAVFEAVENTPAVENTALVIVLKQNHDNPKHTLGRFKISATTSPRPVKAGQVPTEIAELLAIAAEKRTPKQRDELATYYRGIAPALEPKRKELARLEVDLAKLDREIPITLSTERTQPRMIRVLKRGNWMDQSGQVVSPGVPSVLPQPKLAPGQKLDRAELARWLTARENPLTARVLANRLWKNYFGAGLSRKLDDLGAQGEWPSHPELLDWLAGQLIDSGWDLKKTIETIVTSGTYRQSSYASAALREVDPYNRWLARQSRFRLDAEFVRDNAMAVSGLLADSIGGPSVKPYQPPGYWAYLNFPIREWQNGKGEQLYRRGLYTHWQRQYLHPALLAFDAPSREECTAERSRSNTPLQSLVLLNDAEYVEAARAFAAVILREGGTATADRLKYAYRRALSRPPSAAETAVLAELLTNHQAQFKSDPAAAKSLLAVGASSVPTDLDSTELAAWTSVARAILNLHESVTRN